ncbi:hypothetical protein DMH26_33985 [Streptomyces sp. WAC 05379]|nr:hypothetical protein DMH26_33985 [Streptomyces sp. WAC 05379]
MRWASPAVSIGEIVRHSSSRTPEATSWPSSRGPPSVSSRVCPSSARAWTTRTGSTPTPSPAITTRAPAFSAAAIRSGAAAAPVRISVGTEGEVNSGRLKSRSRLALITAMAGAGP